MLAQYDTYQNKMESYKMSISALESQTAIHMELMEKIKEVERLREQREELKVDLQNPEGNAIRQFQVQ